MHYYYHRTLAKRARTELLKMETARACSHTTHRIADKRERWIALLEHAVHVGDSFEARTRPNVACGKRVCAR